jgi:UPF0755 protein
MSALDSLLSSEPLPPSRNRRSVVRRIVAVVAILALIIGAVWVASQLRSTADSNDYSGVGGQDVTIVVNRGDSLTTIGRTLEGAGVVRSLDAFLKVALLDERATTIGPGRYTLPTQIPATEALARMLDPQTRADSRVVVPEGLRLDQTVDTLASSTDLTKRQLRQALLETEQLGLPDWAGGEPEGFLFPATYEISGSETATEMLQTMVRRFDQAAANVDLIARAEAMNRSPYEILIIASLIEAEVAPDDFPKAARVVYNRLKDDMPLQFDSTVGYALGINELFLSRDQLQTKSPYNTYQQKGLPPTPINSPGEAALDAALAPARGKWLYFVSTDPVNGITKFTADYDEFLVFKREFQANTAR